MKTFHKISLGVFVATIFFSFISSSPVLAATAVSLGNADSFAVLGGSGITNSAGPTTIVGDVGTFPTATEIGFGTVTITGVNHAGDATTQLAKTDLTTAYTAAGQPTTGVIAADLGGQTLTPGVYDDNNAPDSLSLTGTLTLDAQNDPNAVFIFKTGSTLTTAAGSTVSLINGAQACNVFWQIGSSVTFGTTSNFKGNVLATASITDNGGSTISGRLLAQNALVTLNNTTVTKATCAAPPSGGSRVGTINVVKTVVNDNGGTKTVADFPLFVNGTPVVSGVTNTFTAPALAYSITETTNANYTRSFSGDCDVNGQLNLNPGDNKFCIITNNDIGAPTPVPPVPPLIDVVKVPNPLSLPNGPGSVLYTYTLRNIGTVAVTDVTMVGDTCSPIVRVSGDTNGDNKLDLSEVWVHTCTTNLTATHTNTVVATGHANGITATDIASATVVVGQAIVPPLIHITKVPDPLTLASGGGFVTYTKKVTNPGIVALSNVRVTDDKCGPVNFISGDTNGDAKLDPSETWTYTCRTHLVNTVTNTAVATGEANGFTARDFAIATVVVANSVPQLPATGYAPTNIRDMLMLFAAVVAALGTLAYVIKKHAL